MMTLSKALSAGQVGRYHAEEFSNVAGQYYAADQIGTAWHGSLAADMGLSGVVADGAFRRLADGQHPVTGEQLVQMRAHHRAGWDAQFGASKSVSLVALVGGDDRIREAHRQSVAVALADLEQYAQARMGGNYPAQTTGRLAIATFEHDSARPVDGYAAPQLHTHCVVFNVTTTAAGNTRALQPKSLYDSQQLATAVYRNELARRLTELGYIVERGESNQPDIRGISAEYMEASSPRRAQILAALDEAGRTGAAAAQIAALQTREAKIQHSHEVMQAKHKEIAASFGNEAERVAAMAHARGVQHVLELPAAARDAVTYAVDRNIERDAVVDERAIRRDALVRVMGTVPTQAVTAEVASRAQAGALLERQRSLGQASKHFTTPEMVRLEQETIDVMRHGQNREQPLAQRTTRDIALATHQQLYASQRAAVTVVLESPDRIMAIQGLAGTGKTTALQAIADAVRNDNYLVIGLAPTSKAATNLHDAGIETQTLQRKLAAEHETTSGRILYVLDESSLASTRQMHAFLTGLQPNERVLLVGDIAQHQSVEAGRIFAQLQESGMRTAHLDGIIRQANPAFKAVVEQLSRGEVPAALAALHSTGQIREEPNQDARLRAIAQAYAAAPASTIVIAPDNDSRERLNEAIGREMATQRTGRVKEVPMRALEARSDLTGPDRGWAAKYQAGDVIRYSKGSKQHALEPGDYATVVSADTNANTLTVKRHSGTALTYDPSRLKGVTVHREVTMRWAVGDRVQMTQPSKAIRVKNRELGTVAAVSPTSMRVKMDSGRSVGFAFKDYRHVTKGYSVTSYSSQGLTADRVILAINTGTGGGDRRTAYVAASRARHDVQIWTDDAARMGITLNRDRSHSQAIAV
jgi:conjugative relaxase-like TrwC/TraI family protein